MFTISIFTKDGGILSKTITKGGDGTIVSDASECRMSTGVVTQATVNDLHALNARIIEKMGPEHAIALGRVSDATLAHVDDHKRLRVVTKAQELKDGAKPGTVTRSQEYFSFRQEPGLMLLDVDFKGCPPEMKARIKQRGVWDILCSVVPDLRQCAHAIRASTSAGIRDAETGDEYPASDGLHIYVLVANAADIPRALSVLADKLQVEGWCWSYVSASGAQLPRTIVDRHVGLPERLIFEGPARLGDGLEQDAEARKLVITAGEVWDTSKLENLTRTELVLRDGQIMAAKDRTAAQAQRMRTAADQRAADEMRRKDPSLSHHAALSQARARHEGRLLPHVILHFDDPELGAVTVAEVFADPDKFAGHTLRDPCDYQYGPAKAMLLRGEDGLLIHSFAHGPHVMHLVAGHAKVITDIERAAPEAVVAMAVEAIVSGGYGPVETDMVVRAAAKRSGSGIGVVRRALNERRQHDAAVAAERATAADRERDTRSRITAPSVDEPHDAWARPVDRILAAVAATGRHPSPPLRDAAGRLVVVEQVPSMEAPVPGVAQPKVTSMRAVSNVGVAMLVESFVRVVVKTKNGWVETRTPDRYAQALNELVGSEIPRVLGVQTTPMVLQNGNVTGGRRYDPATRILFAVPQELMDALEFEGHSTVEDAQEAFDWLCENWLCDVQTTRLGMASIVAFAATLIQRLTITDAYGFIIGAGQVASGKSTIINMVSMLVLGHRAAMSPWPGSEDERRKGLTAMLLSGTALIAYDNVKRGETLSSPAIEAAMTSGVHRDRVLGQTEVVTMRVGSVFGWTGNSLSQSKDIATRTLDITLWSDRPDPENRDFKHIDPVGWTRENRNTILAKIFTILRVDKSNDVGHQSGRFKSWASQVGRPIELASGVSFAEAQKAKTEVASAGAGLSDLLRILHDNLGDTPFQASAVVALLNPPIGCNAEIRALADDLHDAFVGVNDGDDFNGVPNSRSVGWALRRAFGAVASVRGQSMVLERIGSMNGSSRMQVMVAKGPPTQQGDGAAAAAPVATSDEAKLHSTLAAIDREMATRGSVQEFIADWLDTEGLTTIHSLRVADLEVAQNLLAEARAIDDLNPKNKGKRSDWSNDDEF